MQSLYPVNSHARRVLRTARPPLCRISDLYLQCTEYRLQYTLRSNPHADRPQRGVHSRAAAENGHGGGFQVAIATAAMQITLPSLLVMVALLINLQVSVNLSAVRRSGREQHVINEVVYNCQWAAPVRVSPRPQRLKDLASAVRPRIVNFMWI